MGNWGYRVVATMAATTLAVTGVSPAAGADENNGTAAAATPQLLLVHGYGDADKGKDCNGSTWKSARDYYQNEGKLDPGTISTIGYYKGDAPATDGKKHGCDVIVGDGKASNERKIQDIAKDFANYIHDKHTSKGKPVNIVAHSMGGLVTRVALLGSAQGWKGFPAKLNVNNVVTLGTPHNGLHPDAKGNSTEQWDQMQKGSGFLKRLREKGSGLGDDWASGTDWSLVGSTEDKTVDYDSAIDKGNHADQKFGYKDNGGKVTHSKIRTLKGAGGYHMFYWHSSGDHGPHETNDGWSPLKTAYKAALKVGDDLPK